MIFTTPAVPWRTPLIYERTLLALSFISTVLILWWLLKYTNYGLDFTDEGFYLVWMENPFLYKVSATQFGFIYHPLYALLNGDVAALRKVNLATTFALSWLLAHCLLMELAPTTTVSTLVRLVVSAGFATASLIAFQIWLVTPNYNTLALQALLLTTVGLILADKLLGWKSLLGWTVIGIGGWLTFMAKPSTALALAVASLLFLIVSRKFSPRLFLIALAWTLLPLSLSALAIDGSIHKFIERLVGGVESATYLNAGHSAKELLRLDRFSLSQQDETLIGAIAALTFLAGWAMNADKSLARFFSIAVSLIFFGVVTAVSLGLVAQPPEFGPFPGLLVWSVVSGAALLFLLHLIRDWPAPIQARNLPIALLFLSLPHIFAFGTNNNYWTNAALAAVFWLLLSPILLASIARLRREWLFTLPFVLATQAITAVLLLAGVEKPYRQPQALRLNDIEAEVGVPGSTLILSGDYARYIKVAKNAAQSAGFLAGAPIIDLTGQSPGLLYALQAKSIGQPWMIGGYPGSDRAAVASLGRASCEQIASAWVLHSPHGRRAISTQVLQAFGADISDHFTPVASWETPIGVGGDITSVTQILYKPIRPSNTLEACLERHHVSSL